MGSLGYRTSCSCYWHKAWPYKSLLTGQTCGALADDYEKATGNQWLQQLGASLALFEVAAEALKASGSPNDKAAVAKAVSTLNIVTVNGKVQFGAGPVPNVAVMPVLCFQYMKAKSGPFKLDLIITENALDANVAVQGKLVPYSS